MRTSGVSAYLFRKNTQVLRHEKVYILMGALPVIALLAGTVYPPALWGLLLCFGINIVLHYRTSYLLQAEVESIRYMVSLVRCADTLMHQRDHALQQYVQELEKPMGKFRRMVWWAAYFFPPKEQSGGLEVMVELVQILFLTNIISFIAVHRLVSGRKEELGYIHRKVGELDCCMSIASYRQSVPVCCRPDFSKERVVKAEGMIHPLIGNCVPNDLMWSGHILLTGSNAPMFRENPYLFVLLLSMPYWLSVFIPARHDNLLCQSAE